MFISVRACVPLAYTLLTFLNCITIILSVFFGPAYSPAIPDFPIFPASFSASLLYLHLFLQYFSFLTPLEESAPLNMP